MASTIAHYFPFTGVFEQNLPFHVRADHSCCNAELLAPLLRRGYNLEALWNRTLQGFFPFPDHTIGILL